MRGPLIRSAVTNENCAIKSFSTCPQALRNTPHADYPLMRCVQSGAVSNMRLPILQRRNRCIRGNWSLFACDYTRRIFLYISYFSQNALVELSATRGSHASQAQCDLLISHQERRRGAHCLQHGNRNHYVSGAKPLEGVPHA